MKVAQLSKLLVALITLGVAGPASAIMVDFSVSGTITNAGTGNAFGLSVNDSVSMTGTFDSPVLPTDGWVAFNNGSGNSFTITLGSVQLTQSMDIDFASLFYAVPALRFSNGSLIETDMIMESGTNGSPVDFNSVYGGLDFEGDDGLYGIWGHWLPETLVMTPLESGSSVPVPEPATLWLLGSSLLGFFGFRRRAVAAGR